MRTYSSVSPINKSEMRILTWSVFLNRGVRPLTHKDVMNFQVADRPSFIFSRSRFLAFGTSRSAPRRLAQALKEAAAREQEQAAKAAGGGRSSFQV